MGGRAAARLGQGGSQSLADAANDAQSALNSNSNFVFSYRTSFNSKDLKLIKSFAKAELGQFAEALAAADEIADSGIEQGNQSTWVVGGKTYDKFETAVLAYLNKLSNDYSG